MGYNKAEKIEYKIGSYLMFLYILTSYVAVDVIIPSTYNTLFLYVFLGWGLLIALMYGVKEKISTYTSWYAIFMIVSLFCMAYSPTFSILSGEFYLMIVSFLLTYLIQLFIQTEKDFKFLAWVYSISSFLMILMLQYKGKLKGNADERLGEEFVGNANIFAFMIMFAVLMQVWLLLYESKGWVRKLALSGMIIFNMYALALSAGRKFFVLPFVFLYLLLIFRTNKKGKRNIVLYTVISVIICVIAFNVVVKIPVLYESVGVRLEQLIEGQQDESKLDSSAKAREEIRIDSFEQWWEKPVFGYGFDSYKYRAREITGHFYYSHCNYTEMLYNGGIVYFCIYYCIYFAILIECFKKKNVSQKYRSFALAIALIFIVLDYGSVTYSAAPVQIGLCLALKGMNIETDNELQGDEVENGKAKNIN